MQNYTNKAPGWNLQPIFDHKLRSETLQFITNTIGYQKLKFDSIVCCGVSGLGIVPLLAHNLNKNILVVRKEADAYFSHTEKPIEGFTNKTNRYIIVDDLVESGKSIFRMMDELFKIRPLSLPIGIILYNQKKAFANDFIFMDEDRQHYFEYIVKNKKYIKVPIYAFSL